MPAGARLAGCAVPLITEASNTLLHHARRNGALVCRLPHVKAMGVCVLPDIPEPEDEENPPVLLSEQTERGPASLEAADKDADVGRMHAWAPLYSSCSRTLPHRVAGVRSVAWPGAVAIALDGGKSWANMYVGWGIKRGGAAQLPAPPAMAAEAPPPQECDDLPPPRQKEADEEAEDE